MKRTYHFETQQLHAGQPVDSQTKARAVPIYQTSSYVFDNAAHAEALFALKENGNVYSRMMNPTTDVFEQRMAVLEGGTGAVATSSGAAAINYAILNIAGAGDEIVAAGTLYGGTYNLFAETLPRYGVKTTFVDPDDPANFTAAITDRTKAIYVESIGNPGINIIDLEKVASIAHENGIPLIVDNTFASPYLLRPFEHGADVVVHSATKFIGGHGTTIGGVIVDGGTFDWAASGKFPCMTEPDEGYHGLVYAGLSNGFVTKIRVQLLRDMGACLSPFNAFLLLQGLETLSLRVERHVENARKIVEFLAGHEKVAWVSYPGLPDSPYHELSIKYFPKGSGSIFAFGVKGGEAAARKLIDSLEIFSDVANVADAKSILIHPASTTHQQLSAEQQKKAGVTPDMIRISIGLETAADLIEDLRLGLERL